VQTPPVCAADAQRNRDRLLSVAVRAFSQDGADVPRDAIAREAGVGIGTLYRHFPTREALVEAAYRTELDKLCDAAPALLAALPPDQGAAGLDGPVRRLHDHQARDGRGAEGGDRVRRQPVRGESGSAADRGPLAARRRPPRPACCGPDVPAADVLTSLSRGDAGRDRAGAGRPACSTCSWTGSRRARSRARPAVQRGSRPAAPSRRSNGVASAATGPTGRTGRRRGRRTGPRTRARPCTSAGSGRYAWPVATARSQPCTTSSSVATAAVRSAGSVTPPTVASPDHAAGSRHASTSPSRRAPSRSRQPTGRSAVGSGAVVPRCLAGAVGERVGQPDQVVEQHRDRPVRARGRVTELPLGDPVGEPPDLLWRPARGRTGQSCGRSTTVGVTARPRARARGGGSPARAEKGPAQAQRGRHRGPGCPARRSADRREPARQPRARVPRRRDRRTAGNLPGTGGPGCPGRPDRRTAGNLPGRSRVVQGPAGGGVEYVRAAGRRARPAPRPRSGPAGAPGRAPAASPRRTRPARRRGR
jgi:AcrR family transcriptional regulator